MQHTSMMAASFSLGDMDGDAVAGTWWCGERGMLLEAFGGQYGKYKEKRRGMGIKEELIWAPGRTTRTQLMLQQD